MTTIEIIWFLGVSIILVAIFDAMYILWRHPYFTLVRMRVSDEEQNSNEYRKKVNAAFAKLENDIKNWMVLVTISFVIYFLYGFLIPS